MNDPQPPSHGWTAQEREHFAEEGLQPGVERERIKRKCAWEEIAAKYRNIRYIHQKGKGTGARKEEKNRSGAVRHILHIRRHKRMEISRCIICRQPEVSCGQQQQPVDTRRQQARNFDSCHVV